MSTTLRGSFGRTSVLGLCVCGFSLTSSLATTVFDVTEINTNLNAISATFYAINHRGEAAGGNQIFAGGTHSRLMIYLPQAAWGLPAGLNEIDPPAPAGDAAYLIRPYGFNEHGKIAGTWRLQSDTLADRGFIWDQGQFTDLGRLVSCAAVNNDGWIAGAEYFTDLAKGYPTVRQGGPPILITNTPFGPPHGYVNLDSVAPGAVAINDSGQVLLSVRHNYRATSNDPEISDFAVFTWQDGTNQTIPGIGDPPGLNGGSQTFASDLNNRGEAVGRDASGVWLYLPQAAYGLSAGIHILDSQFRVGQKINDLGTVLLDGNSTLYWQTGQVVDAQNKLPTGSPWILNALVDLNNPGQILATAKFGTDSTVRNVILTPRTIDVITVNDAADAPDADPDDGVIDTDLAREGLQITLRAAINYANSTNRPGADTIDFNIGAGGPVTISPTNALPVITEPLTIDGITQPGSGRVGMSGLLAGVADGLQLMTSNCVVRGLAINGFQRAGILIQEGFSHMIIGNILGTDANGTPGLGNGVGLLMQNSMSNIVGGLTPDTRNVVSANLTNGIVITNSANIEVRANLVGTTPDGNVSLPNGNAGLLAQRVTDLTVGTPGTSSVFSSAAALIFQKIQGGRLLNCNVGLNALGNGSLAATINGLLVESSSGLEIGIGASGRNFFGGISSNAITLRSTTNVQAAANYIGTDRTGSTNMPVGTGIVAEDSQGVLLGVGNLVSVICATNGAVFRNLSSISTNLNSAINTFFGLGANGTSKVGNMVNGLTVERSSGLNLGGAGRLIFAGISSNGISLRAVTNVQIPAVFIGTDRTGNSSVPVGTGIFAEAAQELAIGSSNALSVISATNGALLRSLGGLSNTLNNVFFGLAANGTNKLGNMVTALRSEQSGGLRLGELARNIFGSISSNAISFQEMTNVQLFANLFGTDATGTNRMPIGGSGISAVLTRLLTIGDDSGNPAGSVVIGNCGRNGIEAIDSPQLRIVNTAIGTDFSGAKSLANNLSAVKVHFSAGFAATATSNTTVIRGNTIAFNGGAGVEFTQDPATIPDGSAQVVERNQIYRNAGNGIQIGPNVSSVTIGGVFLAAGNLIASNAANGISKIGNGDRVFVEINSISSNAMKAFERILDPQNQSPPQITSAVKGSTHVQGTVNGQPNQTVRLHFYAHRPKAGAQGEGQMWVGTVNVPLNGSGVGAYDSALPRTSPNGWLVASTAADPVRGTSEFSNSQIVQLPTDTDGDGMPDFWEALYPSCLNQLLNDAHGDCDHDGFTNLQEYIAHTDPTQANSVLKVENPVVGGGSATLRFTGVAGRQYGLERRLDLSGSPWMRLVTAIPEADGLVMLTDPKPPAGNAYYRLVAEFP